MERKERELEVFSIENTSTPIARAKEIMGEKNFFGIEDAEKYFNVPITEIGNSNIPISENHLKNFAEGGEWILAWVPALSVLQMTNLVNGQFLREGNNAKYHLPFARHLGVAKWEMIKRKEIAHSASRTYGEQINLLADDEEVPTSRVLTYIAIGQYLKNNEILFSDTFVRCSEKIGNYRVVVAQTKRGEISIGGALASERFSNLGLAVAKSIL